jgi:hypothetical protein
VRSRLLGVNATAEMLEVRAGLVERVRRVELGLARAAIAEEARSLLRGRSHELGNLVQIVKLATLELGRRLGDNQAELIGDLRTTADKASAVLTGLLAAAHPRERTEPGAKLVPVVRATLDELRPAIAAPIELVVELDAGVRTLATGDELDALVIAAGVEAAAATRIELTLRERPIRGKRWIQLLRTDDRRAVSEDALATALAPFGPLAVVAAVADAAGGAASLSPGRTGPELAVELPPAEPAS